MSDFPETKNSNGCCCCAPFQLFGAVWNLDKDIKKEEERKRIWFASKKQISELYQLHPADFEVYVAELYKRLGYKTQLTKQSGDDGIDIFAKKYGKQYVIQVKKTIRLVGSPIIQKLYGSMGHARADYGICVTLGSYSTQARYFAAGKPIELVGGCELINLIRSVDNQKLLN